MGKHFALTICLALLAWPVMAAPPQTIPFPNAQHRVDSIIVPPASPVPFSGLGKNKYGQDSAAFKGRFLLTGTYYYGDNDFNDSGDENPSAYKFSPQAYLVPDDAMAARLPHFGVRNARRPLFIENPEAFAKAVISEAAQRQVRCRKCGAASGRIAIWVDQFSAQIACDAPDYEVRFLSVDRAQRLAIVPRPERGC